MAACANLTGGDTPTLHSCHLLPFNSSLSLPTAVQSTRFWLSALHEVIRRMHIRLFKPGLLAERAFPSPSSCPAGHCCSSSSSSPRMTRPPQGLVCSAQLNSPPSVCLGKGEAFPSSEWRRLKLLYLLYSGWFQKDVCLYLAWWHSDRHQMMFGDFRGGKPVGFSSWYPHYKEILSGSCKQIQKHQTS